MLNYKELFKQNIKATDKRKFARFLNNKRLLVDIALFVRLAKDLLKYKKDITIITKMRLK